jgi:hypothetical protein
MSADQREPDDRTAVSCALRQAGLRPDPDEVAVLTASCLVHLRVPLIARAVSGRMRGGRGTATIGGR